MSPERFLRLRTTLERRQPDLTVLLENVHKPHNLGAILRTCDAVGVLTAHAVVPGGGGVRRSSNSAGGSGKWVDVETHATVDDAVAQLRSAGLRIVAAHLTPTAVDFRDLDFTRPTALLLGQEKYGVTAAAEAAADDCVVIPMLGLVTSLNVSVAAALILFEAQRQRQAAGLYASSRLAADERARRLFEWAYPELAAYCRRQGLAYPRLSADGDLLDPIT